MPLFLITEIIPDAGVQLASLLLQCSKLEKQ